MRIMSTASGIALCENDDKMPVEKKPMKKKPIHAKKAVAVAELVGGWTTASCICICICIHTGVNVYVTTECFFGGYDVADGV